MSSPNDDEKKQAPVVVHEQHHRARHESSSTLPENFYDPPSRASPRPSRSPLLESAADDPETAALRAWAREKDRVYPGQDGTLVFGSGAMMTNAFGGFRLPHKGETLLPPDERVREEDWGRQGVLARGEGGYEGGRLEGELGFHSRERSPATEKERHGVPQLVGEKGEGVGTDGHEDKKRGRLGSFLKGLGHHKGKEEKEEKVGK
ncbi:hypothetical protein MMC19_000106 [Ptychographa xylographoides]|nr:hypothetical protein [Ptychographa xylographoides]